MLGRHLMSFILKVDFNVELFHQAVQVNQAFFQLSAEASQTIAKLGRFYASILHIRSHKVIANPVDYVLYFCRHHKRVSPL